jgi:hypothetical protein
LAADVEGALRIAEIEAANAETTPGALDVVWAYIGAECPIVIVGDASTYAIGVYLRRRERAISPRLSAATVPIRASSRRIHIG